MQLIEITNVPMKLKFCIENAKLKKSDNSYENEIPSNSSNNIEINRLEDKLDIVKSSSLKPSAKEYTDNSDNLEISSAKLSNDALTAVFEYKKISNLLSSDSESQSSNSIYTKNILEADNFVPIEDADKLNTAESVRNQIGHIDILGDSLEFIPGSFGVEVISEAEVIIEYIGGYNYVPPSSDPEYDENAQ